MAIYVTPSSSDIPAGSFTDATGYHVDEEGRLHITEVGKGNIATYHAAAWVSVERVGDGK